MKIAVCGSLDFTHQIKQLSDVLKGAGFKVSIPISAEKILRGEFSLDDIMREKEEGNFSKRAIQFDSIRAYWDKIQKADAILVANYTKKDTRGYIGGNSFLEMGFAHVLHKPIFVLNELPGMLYSDELQAMQPVVLHGDIASIVKHLRD